MARYCARDDQPVRKMQSSDKEYGRSSAADGEYIHVSTDGVPSCGKRVLAEHETYTEGEDVGPINEPQL